MGFKQGFGDKAGKNTANALFNLLGIDFSDRRRVSVDLSEKRQAQAEYVRTKADIAEKNQLNLIDQAVLENVDKVVGIAFSYEPEELCVQLSQLAVQLETNSWGDTNDEEAKIRNKYTSAVLSKFKLGVKQLSYLDPNNPHIDEFQDIIRKANRRRFWGQYKIWIILLAVFVSLIAIVIVDENQEFFGKWWPVFAAIGALIVCLLIYIPVHRNKVKNNRIMAYMKEHSTTPSEDEPRKVTPSTEATSPVIEKTVVPESMPTTPVEKPIASTPMKFDLYDSNIGARRLALQQRYNEMWAKYGGLHEIMSRGYAACETLESKSILIVGFNPSYGGSSENQMYRLPIETSGYWGNVLKMIWEPRKHVNLTNKAAYIDMFAFRETHQDIANKEIIQNPKLFPYVVEQISFTQELIENIIKPQIIVIKNQGAWAFWGKLPQFTWMGYKFEHIEDTPHGELCRIRGFRKDNDRINSQITKSNIDGAYVLFTTHTAVDTYPTPAYLQELLESI